MIRAVRMLCWAAAVGGTLEFCPQGARADFTVYSQTETPPFSTNESADDVAIWLHPTDPNLSVVIGTNTNASDAAAGLHVYDLDGTLLSSVIGDAQNNVDLRYGFLLDGIPQDIVASTNHEANTIDFFTIDAATRTLSSAGSIATGFGDPYGMALWNDRENDKFYAFVSNNDGSGSIRQFELFDNGGSVGGSLKRSFSVGSITEGLVVDDLRGALFVGEQSVGIWRYDADPAAGAGTGDRIAIGQQSGQVRAGDVEGLAVMNIYDPSNEQGYLLASEQGNNSYAILERYDQDGDGQLYEYLGRFRLGSGGGIDAASDTDGIDVISTALGPDYPGGLFVAQDGSDDAGVQNYKFASWSDVMTAAASDNPSLTLYGDPDFDPRDDVVWVSTLTSAADGNWHAASTWDNGELTPTAGLGAIVGGHAVTVNADGAAASLSIQSGSGRLTVDAAAELRVVRHVDVGDGTLDLRGTLSAASVDVGAGALQIQGQLSTASVQVDGGALEVGGTLSTGSVQVGAGTLQVGGTLATEAVQVGSGTLDVLGILEAESLQLGSGTLRVASAGTLLVDTMEVSSRSTVDTGAGRLAVGNCLTLGATEMTVTGGTFEACGSDLVEDVEHLTLSGGKLTLFRPGSGSRKILLVSDLPLGDSDDPLVALLESFGHTVDTRGMAGAYQDVHSPFSDSDKVDALNDADLVLVSRNSSSPRYLAGRQQWNGLQTPLVLMTGYMTRGGVSPRWGWVADDSEEANRAEEEMVVEAGQESHPFLAGLSGAVSLFDWSDAPGQEAPSHMMLPKPNAARDPAHVVARLDGRPYLLDIPAGFDLDQGGPLDCGVTGQRRAYLGHWSYNTGDYAFDDFITDDFETLLANVLDEMFSRAPPGPLDMPDTHIALTADSTLHLNTNDEAVFGNLSLPGGTVLTVTGAAIRLGDVSAGHLASIRGDLAVRGDLSPGEGPGTLRVEGRLQVEDGFEYFCQLGPSGGDRVEVTEDIVLGDGTLTLEVIDRLPAVGDVTRTVISAGSVAGVFRSAPDPNDHVGHGVFCRRVAYGADAVAVDLFQAADGDTNGDRKVSGSDIENILAANKFGTDLSADWTEGDFTGDARVSGTDIQAILAANLFGTGPYAGIEPGGGNGTLDLIVAPDGLWIDSGSAAVNGYVIASKSGVFTGAPAHNLGLFQEDTDTHITGNLAFSLIGRHRLGDVVGDGWDGVDLLHDLTCTYTIAGRSGTFLGRVVVVPEPTTAAMLAVALLILLWRRRAIRRMPIESL